MGSWSPFPGPFPSFSNVHIIEYGSTLYVGLQLKQNGRPYKAMVRTVSKSWKEAFLKLQKVSSIHYHEFL